jgi:hypothetical protein
LRTPPPFLLDPGQPGLFLGDLSTKRITIERILIPLTGGKCFGFDDARPVS